MKMKLPHLIYCRNITYEDALRGEAAQLQRRLFHGEVTAESAKDALEIVKAEMQRWGVEVTP